MSKRSTFSLLVLAVFPAALAAQTKNVHDASLDTVHPKAIATDPTVKYDYDIVYVRAPRYGDKKGTRWAEISNPFIGEPGSDLVLLHPDGSEEVLVAAGKNCVADPYVAFDGESVYYALLYPPPGGSDIYKIHVKTRQIVQLTHQECTPNTGVVKSSRSAVFNLGPCPVPGNKIMFTSNRNFFKPPRGYPSSTLQLFVMDADGRNVECVGHFNLAGALHPTILQDGRVVFSSLESQGLRGALHWGIWSVNPDGTHWGPVVSALNPDIGAPTGFHFQTQLSDQSIIVEEYYNQNNSGFGTLLKIPPQEPGYPAFGPAYRQDPRNPVLPQGRFYGHGPLPFSPIGLQMLTTFARADDGPADPSLPGQGAVQGGGSDPTAVGKFTHPSGAPDNHLLVVWSMGPVNHQYAYFPKLDAGIYLIKSGKPINRPGQMLLIKNDPNFNEQWPRALVPYKRIYGVDEPKRVPPLANDGTQSPWLPAGTPFGLVGTSSLYKRESCPEGQVPPGSVTATYAGKLNAGYDGLLGRDSPNWGSQGADAGPYANDDIHAIRIVTQEPSTRLPGKQFYNHANERLRILGEIPVRKFSGGRQPTDPDGNPDTSFLAKIPADTSFTFQTLDKNGMVLNASQTWHQLRPGEIRNDCGGCHAHSQQPTLFEQTFAARPAYVPFDLTQRTPLLTSRDHDESRVQWDEKGETGLRYVTGVKDVEYYRDIKPIFARSCAPCHTVKDPNPPGKLVLDDDRPAPLPEDGSWKVPTTYHHLALDMEWKHGGPGYGFPVASSYIVKFQSRRSLLIWKIYGRRTDGLTAEQLRKAEPLDLSIMPPRKAVVGLVAGRDGHMLKVAPLTDEDRFTLVRWIDLGCPVELNYTPSARPEQRGSGWMLDETRPTLTVTYPRAGANSEVARILIGMHDYYTGLEMESFRVTADFPVDDAPAGADLASRFKQITQGVWQLTLNRPLAHLASGKLTVEVKDRQGNLTRIDRSFWVGAGKSRG